MKCAPPSAPPRATPPDTASTSMAPSWYSPLYGTTISPPSLLCSTQEYGIVCVDAVTITRSNGGRPGHPSSPCPGHHLNVIPDPPHRAQGSHRLSPPSETHRPPLPLRFYEGAGARPRSAANRASRSLSLPRPRCRRE